MKSNNSLSSSTSAPKRTTCSPDRSKDVSPPFYSTIPIQVNYQHECFVTSVIDGDTIKVKPIGCKNDVEEKIRLVGIDCPEKDEAFYQEAKDLVEKSCLNQTAILTYNDNHSNRDKYERLLASVWVLNDDDKYMNLNEVLVHLGLAIVYKPSKHHNKHTLIALQQSAMKQRKGLWKTFKDEHVHFNEGTKRYAFHKKDCSYLKANKNVALGSECLEQGMSPCRRCKPVTFHM